MLVHYGALERSKAYRVQLQSQQISLLRSLEITQVGVGVQVVQ
jgi:hypothetical protein